MTLTLETFMEKSEPEEYRLEDWQGHYAADDLKWDLGEVSPPLKRLREEGSLQPGRTLIPGCGQGHEVVYFTRQGFTVTGVDFAPGAVRLLTRTLQEQGLAARVLHQDFFDLDGAHDEHYDLLLEQTFFCAIAPRDRNRYVGTVLRVLRPGGLLAGLFYETGEAGGPPFNTTREDLIRYFSPGFSQVRLERCGHSAERRQGKEWLVILRKK